MLRFTLAIIATILTLSTYAIGYTYQAASGIKTTWATTDMIGVFAENDTQLRFDVSSINTSDNHKATFNGYGISLKNSRRYFALSPYSQDYYQHDNISTALPISFPTLTQTSNGSISHIAPMDLMAASVTTTTENKATFNFNHLCSIIRLEVKVPENATFNSVTLASTKGTFLINGTLNLETLNTTPTKTSSTLDMTLNNIYVSRGSNITVYLITMPTDMTGGTITATFTATDGRAFDCSFEGRKLNAAKVYNIGRTLFQTTSAQSKQQTPDTPDTPGADETATAKQETPRNATGVVTYPDGIITDFAIALNDISYAPLPPLTGDADGNGMVNNGDIMATANHITGSTPTGFNATAADANNDGEINVGDLTKISNIINKK